MDSFKKYQKVIRWNSFHHQHIKRNNCAFPSMYLEGWGKGERAQADFISNATWKNNIPLITFQFMEMVVNWLYVPCYNKVQISCIKNLCFAKTLILCWLIHIVAGLWQRIFFLLMWVLSFFHWLCYKSYKLSNSGKWSLYCSPELIKNFASQ